MKRPILAILIGYIIGILWGYTFKLSIVFFWVLLYLIFLLLKNKRKIYKYIKFFKKIIIIIFISSIVSNTIMIWQNNRYEKLYYNTNDVEIVGMLEKSFTKVKAFS